MTKFNSRRNFLKYTCLSAVTAPVISALTPFSASAESLDHSKSLKYAPNDLSVVAINIYVVKVNKRGDWVFVELVTNKGITGLGEASQSGSSSAGQDLIKKEIYTFFEMVKGDSPFNIEKYRQRGWARASSSKRSATAFSSIEQALWDLKGKALGLPVHQLLGGKLRDTINVYANINRATNELDANGRRTVASFQQNAELALKHGFKAVKMAPFDEMKPLPGTSAQIEADVSHAIKCIEGVRKTIGDHVELLVDVHSHLDKSLGIATAKRVEPYNLYWFEEAVNPSKYPDETKAITDATEITTAGGESIFGRTGFAPLIQLKALDILMPDVKHCGGLQELKYIAAMAETSGINIAPHNPSGPIATGASVQVVATIPNFSILEMAYGEVPWRSELVYPPEAFSNGQIQVSDRPGIGYDLNHKVLKKHV